MSQVWAKCSPQKALILIEIQKTESTQVRPTKVLLILSWSNSCINACESWPAIKVHSVPTKAESRVKWFRVPLYKSF